MTQEPWHLKAARELGGTVTTLSTPRNGVYGHKVEPVNCAPYFIHFGITTGKHEANVYKDAQGVKRRVATVDKNGRLTIMAEGLKHVRAFSELEHISPSATRLKELPKLVTALRTAHAALKKHALK